MQIQRYDVVACVDRDEMKFHPLDVPYVSVLTGSARLAIAPEGEEIEIAFLARRGHTMAMWTAQRDAILAEVNTESCPPPRP